jgi:hypothetical protein
MRLSQAVRFQMYCRQPPRRHAGRPVVGLVAALVVMLVVTSTAAVSAQQLGTPSRLRLLIDCQQTECDHDYFQTSIAFVDYVRERQDADVHLLVTSRSSGAGGQEFTLAFRGQGRFAGVDDDVVSLSVVEESEDSIRATLTRLITLGLVRYLLRSDGAQQLQLTVRPPVTSIESRQDPWNSWTFRTYLNAAFTGERSTVFEALAGSFTASRTTDASKFNMGVQGTHRRTSFRLPGGETFVTTSGDYSSNALLVGSVGGHWSTGVKASVSSSTFLNQRMLVQAAPAIEYDWFPYSESTRRLLTFQYAIGVRAFDYAQETIFNKTTERVGSQSLRTSLTLRQPWGTVGMSVQAATFVPELRKNSATLVTDLDLRLARGLAFNIATSLSSVRDQVYLPKAEASTEEVLVRQRQLATSYRYYVTFGVSYTFGSIFSPVVNPRFDPPGGVF